MSSKIKNPFLYFSISDAYFICINSPTLSYRRRRRDCKRYRKHDGKGTKRRRRRRNNVTEIGTKTEKKIAKKGMNNYYFATTVTCYLYMYIQMEESTKNIDTFFVQTLDSVSCHLIYWAKSLSIWQPLLSAMRYKKIFTAFH